MEESKISEDPFANENNLDKKESSIIKKPSKILIISLIVLASILGIIIVLILTNLIDSEVFSKGTCEYMGETYEDGEKFPAEDGCNTCTCEGSTGQIYCTEMNCEQEDIDSEEEDEEDEDSSSELSDSELPTDIYEEQIYKEYTIDDTRFLVYIRSNMNYHLTNDNGESGVLYAEAGDTEWKSFIKVNELGTSKNNILYFGYDFDINKYVLLLISAKGAGSGEGIAKVVTYNQTDSSWEILECFYFIPEHWDLDSVSNLQEEVETYLDGNDQSWWVITSDTDCSDFEITEG